MPFSCCVPFCKGNSPKDPTVSIYKFPSHDTAKKKWLRAIQRKDFIPSAQSRVSVNSNSFEFSNTSILLFS